MTKPTHYADIEDRTIWRVLFTPPAGMNPEQIEGWLLEHWADPDVVHDKDIYDDGGTEVIFVNPMPNPEK